MKKTFANPTTGAFWSIALDDETITITHGAGGTAGETELIEDAFEARGVPPEALFEELIAELDGSYQLVLPGDLLEQVEAAHEVTLSGRLRAFYERHEYRAHQGKLCRGLECRVDFASSAVLGAFHQEYRDRAGRRLQLIPISSKWVGRSGAAQRRGRSGGAAATSKDWYEEEQQWIGVDATLGDGPVYALYTSGEHEVAYEGLDAFLADLVAS